MLEAIGGPDEVDRRLDAQVNAALPVGGATGPITFSAVACAVRATV